jgi:predicted phosphoribosyltransferase
MPRADGWQREKVINETEIFHDRQDAGRRLAKGLIRYRDENPIVLALPRGGVPVGYEIARALEAPLDVLVARKLGTPDQPELAMGAVAPGGVLILNERLVRWLEFSEEQIERIATRERAEMERRLRLFRGERSAPVVRGKTVILVDDGIATGMTVRAAILSLRRQGPRSLVLAVPVCAAQTAKELRFEVDELVCLKTPTDLLAIGYWYENFEQISDDEVVRILEYARGERGEEL